jgi:pimeloyl-ACP methyl ester carboxylesterase
MAGRPVALEGLWSFVMTQTAGFPRFKTEESRARYMAAYDAALGDWPVPYEALHIPTRLGSTHVIASGPADAPALVLLPSFAGSAVIWRLNVAGLSRHFRTYAVDVIGQPGKSLATRRIRDRRAFAGWFADLLDGLGVQRASIVGCSFGGFLAVNQALETPDRVERVVLISPAGTFASQYWKLTYLMRVRAPFLRLLRRLTGAGATPSLADLRAARPVPKDARWSALMAVAMAESPRVSIIAASVFSAAQLRAIRAPTLLLIGDQERLYPPDENLAVAQARMPQLEGALVPNADHIAAMAQPDDVNARILEFLQRGRAP